MSYYAIVRTDDYIAHHGVKGQRWGIRRYQNEDGTRIGVKKRIRKKWKELSPEEKKARIHKAVAIGAAVGAAAIVAYQIASRQKAVKEAITGKTLKEGTILKRVATDTAVKESGPKFMTPDNKDYDMYKTTFVDWLKNKYGVKKVYTKEFVAKNDVKVCGADDAAKTFKKLFDSDSNFKKTVKQAAGVNRTQMAFLSKVNPNAKKQYDALGSIVSDGGKINASKAYEGFNFLLATNDDNYNSTVKQPFFKALKEQGYHAVIDTNDHKLSGYNTNVPMIMFDHSCIGEAKVRELTKGEQLKSSMKILARQTAAPTLGIAALTGAAKSSTYKQQAKQKEAKK